MDSIVEDIEDMMSDEDDNFFCPLREQGCSKRFRSQAGRTYHIRTCHTNHNIVTPPPDSPHGSESPMPLSPPPLDVSNPDIPNLASPMLTERSSPHPAQPKKNYHPWLTGTPCDQKGDFLPERTPPPPRSNPGPDDWEPFKDEVQFLIGNFLYWQEEMSAGNIDVLLDLWALNMAKHDDLGPFSSYEHMYATIDNIKHGDAPWKTFTTSYAGELGPNAPGWQLEDYEVWFRDPDLIVRNMLNNPDFDGQFDYAPYVDLDKAGQRRWNEFMSGNFSWRHAIYDVDATTQGAMYCPIILGADKTTVSVATGHVEYHLLYLSIGNVHNTVRCAHRNAVVPVGFLAIPKSDRKYDNDPSFRKFKRQLYHAMLATILKPLHPGMTEPVIHCCPDGHYRKIIYDLAAFIADYPEQVALAGTVSGWCPKCTALPTDIDGLHDELLDTLNSKTLWDEYGIDDNILPFTHDFPRADIYKILTPDLLHQVIKGTFKDHLVTWVAAPLFPNLRRFPHGCRFKQWTGDDSKALMKVYVSAIAGHIPSEMTQAISSFLDICYIARHADLNHAALQAFDTVLTKFYRLREVFRTLGVRPTGFSLLRQHSLSHYHHLIEEFRAPGGVCSSITESRHITAVKKPWRRSSRYKALGQMLVTNQRLDKLAAARVDFVNRGMLDPKNPQPPGMPISAPTVGRENRDDADAEEEEAEQPVVGPLGPAQVGMVMGNVTLARTRIRHYPRSLEALTAHINQPQLPALARRFLFDQLNKNSSVTSDDVSLEDCPVISSKISVFHSAVASFFAPSDKCGLRGMHQEHIRSCPLWRGKAPCWDCVFVVEHEDKPGMRGMNIARVQLFFSFTHNSKEYACCLVEWFSRMGRSCDSDTGMWKVRPDIQQGQRLCSVIHLDSILCGAHLLPIFGHKFLPINFDYSYSLDAFAGYYVNHFADHHSHEIIS
ncbi:hypothetical protein BYT27DRAFT_7226532 [Phlegmacium glaucopus]|nr:hypothetical protein BYT27DRAFT_7226532 [Phlegmacium glaucopus]